ncbi:MAG: hypothetical protein FJ390_05495 [Verrucomicrobia bacterium]|nr:hypothetical protein [Verrucomicrobiota bacterium]
MTFFSAFKKFRFRKKGESIPQELSSPLEASLEADLDTPPPLPLKEEPSTSDVPPPIPNSTSPKKTPTSPLLAFVKKEWSRLEPLLGDRWKNFVSSDKKQQTQKIFSKIESELASLKKTAPERDLLTLRPGEQENQWQLWKFPNGKTEVPALLNNHATPLSPSQKTQLLIGVPTRDLVVIPLWISTEGNVQELLELELSSKHLLRRGMMEGLKTIPIETEQARSLIVVLAPTTSPSTATAPYLKAADQFEAAVRLLPHHDADLVVWRELGEICFGFSRKGEYVWFSGTNEATVTRNTLGLIKRMILQLEAESILQDAPRSLHIIGSFSEEERSLLKNLVSISSASLDHQRYHYDAELPQPILPNPPLDLPDEAARTQRLHQEKKLKLKRGIALVTLIYFCIILLAGSTFFLKKLTLRYYQHRIAKEEPAIEQANQTILQWQEFRPAIDPTAYPLDILAEIARQIHGEKIRLITLTGMEGRLQIIGEATDVAQAYHFIEQIKKIPELQEYQWTSGQPKLAGKSSVRFELEGSRSHAKASTE